MLWKKERTFNSYWTIWNCILFTLIISPLFMRSLTTDQNTRFLLNIFNWLLCLQRTAFTISILWPISYISLWNVPFFFIEIINTQLLYSLRNRTNPSGSCSFPYIWSRVGAGRAASGDDILSCQRSSLPSCAKPFLCIHFPA